MITVLSHGRLLDCVGDEPKEDVSIIVEDGMIKDISSGNRNLPGNANVIDLGGKTILPGLTDAHAHPTMTAQGIRRFNAPPILTALGIIRNLELDLQAGFTTLCGFGGPNWALKHAVEEGLIKSPRLLIACSSLSKTGGHGDWSNFRDGIGDAVTKDVGIVAVHRLADGIDEVRKAAREQLRNGADLLKIFATGGGGSPNDEATDAGYSEEEIHAVVEEAEDNGKYVAAHCDNQKGIKRSIKCGVRSIQHGVGFDREAALMLKEKGAYHVPTLMTFKTVAERGAELGAPPHFIRKAIALVDEAMKSAELTHRLKCNIGFGTGCGPSYCQGKQGIEFKLRTECGMKPLEVIKTATIGNARLFRMESRIGSIEPGKWADIIAVDGKPDENIELLCEPNNIKLVMKSGQIMKNIL